MTTIMHWARIGAVVTMMAMPAVSKAASTCTTNNGTITIVKFGGNGGTVNIPNTINGLPVTGIGNGAFWSKDNVTSVIIPDSVTNIGEGAFLNCTRLSGVTFGNGLINIGDRAFRSCINLTNVTMQNGVTSIGNESFFGCSSLSSVTIPESVISIGDRAFYNCSRLPIIPMPKSVTNVGSQMQGTMAEDERKMAEEAREAQSKQATYDAAQAAKGLVKLNGTWVTGVKCGKCNGTGSYLVSCPAQWVSEDAGPMNANGTAFLGSRRVLLPATSYFAKCENCKGMGWIATRGTP